MNINKNHTRNQTSNQYLSKLSNRFLLNLTSNNRTKERIDAPILTNRLPRKSRNWLANVLAARVSRRAGTAGVAPRTVQRTEGNSRKLGEYASLSPLLRGGVTLPSVRNRERNWWSGFGSGQVPINMRRILGWWTRARFAGPIRVSERASERVRRGGLESYASRHTAPVQHACRRRRRRPLFARRVFQRVFQLRLRS